MTNDLLWGLALGFSLGLVLHDKIAYAVIDFMIKLQGKKQTRPRMGKYVGGYAHVLECKNCGMKGLREDFMNGKPCWDCGGMESRKIIAQWDGGKWVTPGINDISQGMP